MTRVPYDSGQAKSLPATLCLTEVDPIVCRSGANPPHSPSRSGMTMHKAAATPMLSCSCITQQPLAALSGGGLVRQSGEFQWGNSRAAVHRHPQHQGGCWGPAGDDCSESGHYHCSLCDCLCCWMEDDTGHHSHGAAHSCGSLD